MVRQRDSVVMESDQAPENGVEKGTVDGVGPERRGDVPADLGVSEKKLVRKLDLYLIPLVMALYLFSFLDRWVIFNT